MVIPLYSAVGVPIVGQNAIRTRVCGALAASCILHISHHAMHRTKAAKSTAYDDVLTIGRVDPDAIYLDLGCFVGTDLRKVVEDGWNPERVIGSDLRSGEAQ